MHACQKAFSGPQSVNVWSAAEGQRDKEGFNASGHMESEALCSACMSVGEMDRHNGVL